ncbi:hypothetical protein VTN77DRAFT_3362 [Rasamsonia byssochlamydoides]|uniref:uncharacterized protein n=1 Tax=Rasamsonia byssochlamydoides TaxID=89139 RepID=UPI0037445F0C
MAQTPKQKRANEKYARHEAAKHGKPKSAVKQHQKLKSPIAAGWVVVLAFVICGGLVFELLRVIPEIWGAISSFFGRWT